MTNGVPEQVLPAQSTPFEETEDSDWEVESDEDSEFLESSEEGSDEDSGDEVLRHRCAKRRAVS